MFGWKKEKPYHSSIKGNKISKLKITDPDMNVNLFKREGGEGERGMFIFPR
jgi:hypothetical protein